MITQSAGEPRERVNPTDGTGALQPEKFCLPQPDGSTSWHHLTVRAMSA
jgi:hypothetical protein